MAFKPTLVAPKLVTGAYPYLGHEITEIVLEESSGGSPGAALPSLESPDDRDKAVESVEGSDINVPRRKLAEVNLDIDFVSDTTKQEIEAMVHDARDIYLSPNFGPATAFSFPLMRSIEDITGNRAVTLSRVGDFYAWDDTDRVFRVWDDNKPAFLFRGPWRRYFRSQAGSDNKSVTPHPTSTGHGWTVSSGSATLTYTENILTPVLSRRATTNGKGVVKCTWNAGAITIRADAGLGGIGGTNAVIGSVCAAWHGSAVFVLKDQGSATVYDTQVVTGDGRFKLVRMGGHNSNAGTLPRIEVTFTALDGLALIGPNLIGESLAVEDEPQIDDWHDGTSNIGAITQNDTKENLLSEFTLTFFARYRDSTLGFLELGSGTTLSFLKQEITNANSDAFTIWHDDGAGSAVAAYTGAIGSLAGLSDGEWFHVAVVASGGVGFIVYINGTQIGQIGTWRPFEPGSGLRIGNVFNAATLANSGISHLRMDRIAWTPAQVVDHYDTFFHPRGKAIIEPAFGKVGKLVDMSWTPRLGSGAVQWLGTLTWKELGPTDHAVMIRQEGDV